MVYKEKFVAVVKSEGRILRESGDTVRLPFGSEYSIKMKNLHSRRAVVNVTIDGEDVLDGNRLVISPNSSVDLKGFLKGSTAKNKFRFIKKTREISNYRGDRVDDGIVRVEFRFEKKDDGPMISFGDFNFRGSYGTTKSCDASHYYYDSNTTAGSWNKGQVLYSCSMSNFTPADEGITVKGSQINQDFNYTDVSNLETKSDVIVLRLVGYNSKGKSIRKSITTKTRVTCPTCGRKWKSSMKYCGSCSTFLE